MHGGDIYTFTRETGKTPLDFSENTNLFGLPEGVKHAIIEQVNTFHVYPDSNCSALAQCVSAYYGVREDSLLFGNGAADIIYKIAYALKPKSALLLAPTFSEYEMSLRQVGTDLQYFDLEEHRGFALTERILDAIPGNDVVYLCNPNNPTGVACRKELLVKIAEKCKEQGAYLIIDECFMDFVSEEKCYSMKAYVETFEHLVILKAFTKIFAMAGLRLGFCISSNEQLLQKIARGGQPWSVSTVAQVAGIACCSEQEYVKNSLDVIEKEREYLRQSLRELGYKTYDSVANYLLFQCQRSLVAPLREQGIMVRSCGNYHNLTQAYYRVAVKRHSENAELIRVLRELEKGE